MSEREIDRYSMYIFYFPLRLVSSLWSFIVEECFLNFLWQIVRFTDAIQVISIKVTVQRSNLKSSTSVTQRRRRERSRANKSRLITTRDVEPYDIETIRSPVSISLLQPRRRPGGGGARARARHCHGARAKQFATDGELNGVDLL